MIKKSCFVLNKAAFFITRFIILHWNRIDIGNDFKSSLNKYLPSVFCIFTA